LDKAQTILDYINELRGVRMQPEVSWEPMRTASTVIRQGNDYDCGVYTCLNAYLIMSMIRRGEEDLDVTALTKGLSHSEKFTAEFRLKIVNDLAESASEKCMLN
jgi:Ulp1 family protease